MVFGVCAWEWGNLAGLSSLDLFLRGRISRLDFVIHFNKVPSFWIISAGLVWWGFLFVFHHCIP